MRARSLAASALAIAVAGTLLTGCRLMRASGKAADSLFSSPRRVTKLKDPIDKNARLAVLWIGHATALVQIDDKVILTDPVFTSSVGQLSKRRIEPGLDPENLPPVDAVLVSHMHFDHLSLGSLDTIERKVRMLLMPPGGVSYLTDFDFPALELRPWQAWEKDGLRVTAVPVDHVGYRYGIDDAWMKRSFTGYVIEYHGIKVYFPGDTAYDQRLFVEVAQRFPGLDLALLPIGPIEPRDVMRRFHTDPAEALQAFIDLGAKRMVPIHYDTFVNSTDEPGDALRGLAAAKKKWDLGNREVVAVTIGERWVFLKKGEGPSPDAAKAKDTSSWSTPATTPAPPPAPAKPAPKPPEKPAKDEIPDDQKLD
jgi:N-acyl-phosphatidylethanolamine-hydrolysing phospholipase D